VDLPAIAREQDPKYTEAVGAVGDLSGSECRGFEEWGRGWDRGGEGEE